MKEKCPLKNDDGSVLVLALIMLVLLTLIGIAASRTASIDIQISGNDIISKQNLYMAEAPAMEAAQDLENNNLKTYSQTWLHPIGTVYNKVFWDNDNDSQPSADAVNLPDSRFLDIYEGLVSGTTLDVSKSKVHSYAIYGRCKHKQNRGLVVINVGYRKAF